MVVIFVISTIIATLVAVLIPWLPDSASEEMDRIAFTYWFATIICIGIFALVAAIIIDALISFRVQPGDDTTARRSTATPASRSRGRSCLRFS